MFEAARRKQQDVKNRNREKKKERTNRNMR